MSERKLTDFNRQYYILIVWSLDKIKVFSSQGDLSFLLGPPMIQEFKYFFQDSPPPIPSMPGLGHIIQKIVFIT